MKHYTNVQSFLAAITNGEKEVSLSTILSKQNVLDITAAINNHQALMAVRILNDNLQFSVSAEPIIKALIGHKFLQQLSLPNINLKDEGVEALAEPLKENKSLQVLVLSDNKISSDGADILAVAIKCNTSLQVLDLSCNNIGHIGAIDLGNAIKANVSLKSLNLYNNNIGEKGAIALDNAIQYNTNILYATYQYQSPQVKEELEKRQNVIKNLITKWRIRKHNSFTLQEIEEFYNKKDSINCVNNSSERDEIIDFPEFERELSELKKAIQNFRYKLIASVIGFTTFGASMFMLNQMASASVVVPTPLKVAVSVCIGLGAAALILSKNSNNVNASQTQIY